MDCNSGIRGDSSDVDIETITDTAWSVEMPGHSIQNISHASAPISIKPLEIFQDIIPQNRRAHPITRLYRIKRTPSRKSGKISAGQASGLKSQTEHSAARCFVILGKEPKLLGDKKFTKAHSLPKYSLVHNRAVWFHVSAATSAITTVRSTERARYTYIRNCAVRAIDKEGSYQHFLHRKIKQLSSIMFRYVQNLDREIRLYHFALDSYMTDFDHELTLLKSNAGSTACDVKPCKCQFRPLLSKRKSCHCEVLWRNREINSMLNAYADALEKKITLLNYNLAPYAHDLAVHITLVNSKINSFIADLKRKVDILYSRSEQFLLYMKREYKLLKSERAV